MSSLSSAAVTWTGFYLNKDAWCYVYSEKKKCFYFSLVNPNELTQVKIEVKWQQEHKNIWTGSDQRAGDAQGGAYKHGK